MRNKEGLGNLTPRERRLIQRAATYLSRGEAALAELSDHFATMANV